ncbi:MAG: glycosyltransferase family 39 protein [Woronichinia naegeliana WA131]|jgi:uncharacterized membrane protein|uniref:Glycosyltransferase family 39 protein n=1 Tax=Woronichinia naegeliana WA131 TaxID=2824559 RepID=A0A977KWS3_9CYAN|nr:MAG: glycosyltransferase family 39 protein [Woronichinia naegeliana WA131]
MLNQLRDRTFEKLNGWKFLIILLLTIGVFLRFAHLDEKVYSADEVRKILWLSGYSKQDFIEEVFTGDIVTAGELRKYQHPNSERTFADSMKVLKSNTEHVPLHHIVTRFGMQLLGGHPSARIVSICVSFLSFPCLYWLCIELFGSPLTGWIAIALTAISPFHILVSQNVSAYTLWTVTTLLSSAALLRALRVKHKSSSLIYFLALALGFYSHLFSFIVAFGQGIYVFVIEGFKLSKTFIYFLFASVLALLSFSPWIINFVNNLSRVDEGTSYYKQFKVSFIQLIIALYYNINKVFIDFFHRQGKLENLLHFFLFLLIIYSLYFLVRYTAKNVWLFVTMLIVLVPIAHIIANFITPSALHIQSRYYLPCFLGIQLAVAYLLASKIGSKSLQLWQRSLWSIILLIIFTMGITSGTIIMQTRTAGLDDQKGTASGQNLEIAPLINQAEKPLVISDTTHSFVLALSYLLKPEVCLQLFPKNDIQQWQQRLNLSEDTQDFSDVFLYFPNDDFLNFIKQDKNFYLESVQGKIYKIVKN